MSEHEFKPEGVELPDEDTGKTKTTTRTKTTTGTSSPRTGDGIPVWPIAVLAALAALAAAFAAWRSRGRRDGRRYLASIDLRKLQLVPVPRFAVSRA